MGVGPTLILPYPDEDSSPQALIDKFNMFGSRKRLLSIYNKALLLLLKSGS